MKKITLFITFCLVLASPLFSNSKLSIFTELGFVNPHGGQFLTYGAQIYHQGKLGNFSPFISRSDGLFMMLLNIGSEYYFNDNSPINIWMTKKGLPKLLQFGKASISLSTDIAGDLGYSEWVGIGDPPPRDYFLFISIYKDLIPWDWLNIDIGFTSMLGREQGAEKILYPMTPTVSIGIKANIISL